MNTRMTSAAWVISYEHNMVGPPPTSSILQNVSSITKTFTSLIKAHHLQKGFPHQPWTFSYISSLHSNHCLPAWYLSLLPHPPVPLTHFAPVFAQSCKLSAPVGMLPPWAGTHCSLSVSPFHQAIPQFPLCVNLEDFCYPLGSSVSSMSLIWTLRTQGLLCP